MGFKTKLDFTSGRQIKQPVNISNIINVETVVAEDNNIELNFNGTHESSIGGGLCILHGLGLNKHAEFKINEFGSWETNNPIAAKELIIPNYTPTGSTDSSFNIGAITKDENFLYVKGLTWKKIKLEEL